MLTFSKSIIEENKIFSLPFLILISRIREGMRGADLLICSLFLPLILHICEFTYLLKFLCNLKINTCDIFLIICSHAQSVKDFSHQEGMFPSETKKKKKKKKLAFCLLISALTCFSYFVLFVGEFAV